MKDSIKNEHPSYGMIQVSRFTGGNNVYYGSSIKHGGGIRISIHKSDMDRHLKKDWHHAGEPLIEVWMSYNQFAEMLTANMNTDGTPCTLKYVNGEHIPDCEFENKRMQFDNEIKKDMANIGNKLDSIVENTSRILSSKGNIKISDRELILEEIRMLRQGIAANVPFIQKQLNRQIDKTIAEAKAEIEGFYEEKIRGLGIKALEDKVKVPEIE